MINSPEEYQKMADVEQHHWWYKILHTQALESIKKYFDGNKKIDILDIGCGTGGLLLHLEHAGYSHIQGTDINAEAIHHCQTKRLNVIKSDLGDFNPDMFEPKDALFCHDVLYFFSKEKIKVILSQLHGILKTDGVLILNLPAFRCFRGIHDLSIGNNENRFSPKDIVEMIDQREFKVMTMHCWPFLLSPLIFIIRFKQRLQLKLFNENVRIKSDIDLPGKLINQTLFRITLLEKALGALRLFGSSQFVVLKKVSPEH